MAVTDRSTAQYSDEDIARDLQWWAAADYVTAAQIHLQDNVLLHETLRGEHIEPRLLGHWGTSPGLSAVYVQCNRLVRTTGTPVLYVTGPGHGGPALVANTYLEGSCSDFYPEVSQDAEGLRNVGHTRVSIKPRPPQVTLDPTDPTVMLLPADARVAHARSGSVLAADDDLPRGFPAVPAGLRAAPGLRGGVELSPRAVRRIAPGALDAPRAGGPHHPHHADHADHAEPVASGDHDSVFLWDMNRSPHADEPLTDTQKAGLTGSGGGAITVSVTHDPQDDALLGDLAARARSTRAGTGRRRWRATP